ncbi:peptidyl-prolyl cis-trans isomerase (rotamase) - cyclophilin family [Opitutaceae bacterium TAV1]|nr:peptidyl-prolyl cis-trans isomerase (rotamase) - cyclophilin family [Opitutaceae bacterium TAV1]
MKSSRRPSGSLATSIPMFVIALVCAFAASSALRAATPAIKARDFPTTHAGSASADYQYINLTEYFDDLDNPAPQKVRFYFSTGDSIDFILHRDWAPNAHDNFLQYVKALRYDGTAIHRSEYNFVVQGGGYIYNNGTYGSWDSIERFAPAKDDIYKPARANTRGTIALAKTGEPDSATSEWFVNIVDNTTALAPFSAGGRQLNGGFFPFAEVADDCVSTYFSSGMEFFDWVNYDIGAYQVGRFDTVPIYENNNGQQYLVTVEAARPTLDFALVDGSGNLVRKITGGATEAALTHGNRYLELKGLAGKNDTDTYRIRATAPDGRTATKTLAVNTGTVLSALAGKTIKLTAPALPKTGDDKPRAGAKPQYQWTFTGADGVAKTIAGATKATWAASSSAPYGSGKYTVTLAWERADGNVIEKTASFIVDFIKKPLQLAAGFAVTPDAPVRDAKGKPILNTVIGADTTITLYEQNNKQTVVKNAPQGAKFTLTLTDVPTGDRPLLRYTWYAGKELLDTWTTTARSDTYYVSADLAARIMYYLRTTKVSINCVVETVATDAKGKPVSTLKTKAVALKTYTVPGNVVITNNADPDNKKSKPVDDGGIVTLSAKATGSATLSYQWQVFSEGQQKWVNIEDGTDKVTGHSVSGSKKNKLTIKKTYATDTGRYRVVVKNFAGENYAASAETSVTVNQQFAPASIAVGLYMSCDAGVFRTLTLTKPVKLPDGSMLTTSILNDYLKSDGIMRVTAPGQFMLPHVAGYSGTFTYKRSSATVATVKYTLENKQEGYKESGTWSLSFTGFGRGTVSNTGKVAFRIGGKSVNASFKVNDGEFLIKDTEPVATTITGGGQMATYNPDLLILPAINPDMVTLAGTSASDTHDDPATSSAAQLKALLDTDSLVLRLTDVASGETCVLDFSDGSLQDIVAEDTAEGDVRITFITQDALGETAAVLILSFGETPVYLLEETRVFIDETGDLGETRKTSAGIFLFE